MLQLVNLPMVKKMFGRQNFALMIEATELAKFDDATRGMVEQLLQRIEHDAQEISKRDAEINWRDAKIEKLTFEMAQLKRVRFGVKSERLNVEQHLFEVAVSADLAAIETEFDELKASDVQTAQASMEKSKPKRAALSANLPRVERHHEPESANCACGCKLKRIGEDVNEKLVYEQGQFTVERYIRGKWACTHCKTLIQAPVPADVIDKGIPTSGLIAHVLVAKHADDLPLVQTRSDIWSRWICDPPFDIDGVGWCLRGAAAALGGCTQTPCAQLPSGACR